MTPEQYIEHLIGIEGGYTNNPNDSGGETIWGVTVAVARAFGYQGDMRAMTKTTAREIYLDRYFRQPRFDQIHAINQNVAAELLDTGVNMGTEVASKFFQRALNALNLKQSVYADIKVDGNIGVMTVAAFKDFMAHRRDKGEVVMLRVLNALQCERYIGLCESREKDEEFVFGWVYNRVII